MANWHTLTRLKRLLLHCIEWLNYWAIERLSDWTIERLSDLRGCRGWFAHSKRCDLLIDFSGVLSSFLTWSTSSHFLDDWVIWENPPLENRRYLKYKFIGINDRLFHKVTKSEKIRLNSWKKKSKMSFKGSKLQWNGNSLLPVIVSLTLVTLFIINPLTLLADNKQKQLTPITTDVIKYLQLM